MTWIDEMATIRNAELQARAATERLAREVREGARESRTPSTDRHISLPGFGRRTARTA